MGTKLDLDGKTIAITGGAGGIGAELARSARARGARVALLDIDGPAAVAAAQELGGGSLGYRTDVCDSEELVAALDDIAATAGGIDVLAINAGVLPLVHSADRGDLEAHRRVFEINYFGALNTLRAGAPHVIARRGHIVFTSSVTAFAPAPLSSAYASSKAAVEMLARLTRIDLAPCGVSVGVAHFGAVATPMVEAIAADELSSRLLTLAPPGVYTQATAVDAAEALVRGIERRAVRTIHPAQWKGIYALRGVLGPLTDAFWVRSRKAQRLVADTRARETSQPTAADTPQETLT